MTRLRTDQACLDAQLQAQVAQRLTAELAVSCPDCGVEAGRACRDSFGRAVKSHLAREVASSKRDTEPCPAPSEGAFKRDLRAMIEAGLAASAPVAVSSIRPVCACGQTIWRADAVECSDCWMNDGFQGPPAPLDQRIREAQPEPPECAWSTPTSDGEGWR